MGNQKIRANMADLLANSAKIEAEIPTHAKAFYEATQAYVQAADDPTLRVLALDEAVWLQGHNVSQKDLSSHMGSKSPTGSQRFFTVAKAVNEGLTPPSLVGESPLSDKRFESWEDAFEQAPLKHMVTCIKVIRDALKEPIPMAHRASTAVEGLIKRIVKMESEGIKGDGVYPFNCKGLLAAYLAMGIHPTPGAVVFSSAVPEWATEQATVEAEVDSEEAETEAEVVETPA